MLEASLRSASPFPVLLLHIKLSGAIMSVAILEFTGYKPTSIKSTSILLFASASLDSMCYPEMLGDLSFF